MMKIFQKKLQHHFNINQFKKPIIMKQIEINVTSENIQDGQPDSIICCPVALACRQSNNVILETAEVHTDCISTEYGIFNLPKNAREFISLFDKGEKVHPFKFSIQIA